MFKFFCVKNSKGLMIFTETMNQDFLGGSRAFLDQGRRFVRIV